MKKILSYLKSYKKQCILGPLFKWLEAVFELIVPLVMASIIDVGIKNNDRSYVIKMCIVLIALGVVGLAAALTAQFFAAQASQGFGTKLRNALYAHIQSLSQAEINKLGQPTLITRMTNDINQLQIFVAMTIRLFLRAPFLVIGATIMAFTIDVKLSLMFLIVTPLLALIIYLVMSKSVPYFNMMQKKLDVISLKTRENLSGIRVVRAFSKQESEIEQFNETNDSYRKTAVRVGKISALLNPLTSVVLNLAIVAVLWFGGKKVYNGNLSQGQIIAFVNYLTQILLAMIVVANLVVIYLKSFASMARVKEVFETESTVADGDISPDVTCENAIEFRDVCFTYPSSHENSLSDISFTVKKGETVGIIGSTGSGKSTLINLIMRYYDTTDGEIDVFGSDVRKLNINELRDNIGLVPQKAVLFSGTIRSNMLMADSKATDEQIYKALEVAQAKDFVDTYEEGLDKRVEQKGRNFSGGQRQRLTIARAMVSMPEILILDDSASALDYATDFRLRKAISKLDKNMTVIIISQRATSIKSADKIIVMENGSIDAIGTHDELLQKSEVYSEIYSSQISSSDDDKR